MQSSTARGDTGRPGSAGGRGVPQRSLPAVIEADTIRRRLRRTRLAVAPNRWSCGTRGIQARGLAPSSPARSIPTVSIGWPAVKLPSSDGSTLRAHPPAMPDNPPRGAAYRRRHGRVVARTVNTARLRQPAGGNAAVVGRVGLSRQPTGRAERSAVRAGYRHMHGPVAANAINTARLRGPAGGKAAVVGRVGPLDRPAGRAGRCAARAAHRRGRGRAFARQYICWPPLMLRVEPVTNPPSSEHRNTTPRAISFAWPSRPTGILATIFSSTSAGTAATMSVSI